MNFKNWPLAFLSLIFIAPFASCLDDVSVDKNTPTTSSSSSSCSEGTVSSPNTLSLPADYVLAWNDEFDSGSSPSTSLWTYDLGSPLLGGTVWGNSERQHYTSSSNNVYVSGGNLVIQAVHETPAGSSGGVIASSARIKSETNDYYDAIGCSPTGFYEIRAKLSCIAGSWPALWLLGKDGDWPARGEIDILEWAGSENNPTKATSAIHNESHHGGGIFGLSNPQYGAQVVSDLCSDEYHLFQLHWKADRLIIGVDGTPTLVYRKLSSSSSLWPFDQPAYLIFNVAVGGTLGGAVNTADIPDMKLEIDYVRVWQNP